MKKILLILLLFITGFMYSGDFTVHHHFDGTDGYSPRGKLLYLNGYIYGNTAALSDTRNGVIYRIREDGTDFEVLHHFSSGRFGSYGGLTLYKDFLYGTTTIGGSQGDGIIYRIRPDGSDYEILHNFNGPFEGDGCYSGLISDNNGLLYGITANDGPYNSGTIFSYNTKELKFTVIYALNSTESREALGQITYSDGKLYCGSASGGENRDGNIFTYDIKNNIFTNLHSYNNNDGDEPLLYGAPYISGNELFTENKRGGLNNGGTILRMNLKTGEKSVIHNFDTGFNGYKMGFYSFANTLVGVTYSSPSGVGSIYRISKDGTNFKILYEFTTNETGTSPKGSLLKAGNKLIGTCYNGGNYGYGTIWSFKPEIADVLSLGGEEITSDSILTGGVVVNPFEAEVLERGVCYSETGVPDYSSDKVISPVAGNSKFRLRIKNLKRNTLYNIRSFIRTSVGVFYSKNIEVRTSQIDIKMQEASKQRGYIQLSAEAVNRSTSPVQARGFCRAVDRLPYVTDYSVQIPLSGDFSYRMKNFLPGTKYRVRAWCRINGKYTYSDFMTVIAGDFYIVSGSVLFKGSAFNEVDIFSDNKCLAKTDSNGEFEIIMKKDTSMTLKPYKEGFVFSPEIYEIKDLDSSINNIVFHAEYKPFDINFSVKRNEFKSWLFKKCEAEIRINALNYTEYNVAELRVFRIRKDSEREIKRYTKPDFTTDQIIIDKETEPGVKYSYQIRAYLESGELLKESDIKEI